MTWGRRAYPVLFAIFPIVGTAAANPGIQLLSDSAILIVLASAATVVAYLVLYAALRLRLRSERAADTAAFVVFWVVAIFFSYTYLPAPLQRPVEFVTGNPRLGPAVLVAIIIALLVAYLVGVHRHLPRLADVGRFLTLVGILLVGWSIGKIALEHIVSHRAITRSTLVHALAHPVPMRTASAQPKRDIYVILLDAYASSIVLRHRFGVDNTPFEDSLRALGFSIPSSVQSNYSNTLVSLPSLLNFAHMQPLAQTVSQNSNDYTPAAYLIDHNRAAGFLKSEGYRFVFFPSSSYTPTRHSSEADEQFELDSGSGFSRAGREIQRSEVFTNFARSTMFEKVMKYLPTEMDVRTADVARTFEGIATMSPGKQPTFVFAHILMPHIPFVEDSTCRPLPRTIHLDWSSSPAGRAGLTAELHCLNSQILRTVHAVLARSDPQPIIILQGDHGTQALEPFSRFPAPTTPAQNRERFRPFGAYYLPGGGASVMPDSVSIVNVLRYVFGYYFGADLPPLPNTMYFSHWKRPYKFAEVDRNFQTVQPPNSNRKP